MTVALVPGGESAVTVTSDAPLATEAVAAALDEAGAYRLAAVRRARLTWSGPDSSGIMSTADLVIGGMTCASCAARVEKKLNRLDGVCATVNLATETARVSFPDRGHRG